MPRKKKINVKVTRSEWDRAKMPRYALAISTTLIEVNRGRSNDEASLNHLRDTIRNDIELRLSLTVDSISLVLVEENPPTII
ncbi:hypothetical protein LCGC14_0442670 [marine sediment metagenome]|uniref:Uncharacterized protein n=1 Tax=marine sediment metagenome TaxID=412755 RepID=A0A0F9T3A4_9ZZZZ